MTIAEADMLKLNMTGGNCFRTFSGIRNFLGLIKQGEYPFRSGNRGLERGDDIRGFCDRLGNLIDILHKRLHRAQRDDAV